MFLKSALTESNASTLDNQYFRDGSFQTIRVFVLSPFVYSAKIHTKCKSILDSESYFWLNNLFAPCGVNENRVERIQTLKSDVTETKFQI